MSHAMFGFSSTKKLSVYLKFKFSWASYILSESEFKHPHAAATGQHRS